MDTNLAPILEFDPQPRAIIEPISPPLTAPAPAGAVMCFFAEVIQKMVDEGRLTQIGYLVSEIGRNPLYLLGESKVPLMVFHPGLGGPLGAGFLEEAIFLGVRKFIAVGGCGVLDRSIAVGHPVVLTSAVRDEGTSYHYLPPSREVESSPSAIRALEETMQTHRMPYLLGKSWTTDAIYRETIGRRQLRMDEGCLVVEMEAASFFAVAKFRGVELGQVVYGGDLVEPEGWDGRRWNHRQDDRWNMFWLAVEACERLCAPQE